MGVQMKEFGGTQDSNQPDQTTTDVVVIPEPQPLVTDVPASTTESVNLLASYPELW